MEGWSLSTPDTTSPGLSKFRAMVERLPCSVKDLVAFDTWPADPARTSGNAGFTALSLISGSLSSKANTRAGADRTRVSTPLERPTTNEVATHFLARFG